MNSIALIFLPALFSLSTLEGEDRAAQWPQFLGPHGSAVVDAPGGALNLDPAKFKLWRTELPSGSCSPIIWGNRIFVSGEAEGQSIMIAIDRETGKKLWEKKRASTRLEGVLHVDSNAAAPTACTDGERVVFYFGQFGLVVLDMDGELLWEKELPVPQAPFGIGTSPILVDDMVILSRDGCADSGIYAFDKRDGKEVWRLPRVGFTYSFGTPFVWNNTERRELIVAGTKRLTSLDPKTGKQLWQVGGLTSFVCTTPTADKDTLYFAAWSTSDAAPEERGQATWGDSGLTEEEAANAAMIIAKLDQDGDGKLSYDEMPISRARDAFPVVDLNGDGYATAEEMAPLVEDPKGRGNNLMIAVKAGGSGDISKSHVRWRYRRGLPYVSSPLLHQGLVYLAKAGGLVSCVDAESGKRIYGPERLDGHGEFYASPVSIGNSIVLCSAPGTITVLQAGTEFKILQTIDLGESIHATPAVLDGITYVRTNSALWALGK